MSNNVPAPVFTEPEARRGVLDDTAIGQRETIGVDRADRCGEIDRQLLTSTFAPACNVLR